MARFVILRHDVSSGLDRTEHGHFDWMFEIGSALRTWATDVVAIDALQTWVDAAALADHRTAYLDFEGEISGDRGRVSRVALGTFELTENSSDRFDANLSWADVGRDAVENPVQRRLLIERLREEPSEGSWRLRLSG